MATLKMMKPRTRSGATLFETNRAVVTVRDGEMSDSHFISPETDPEGFRIVGALGEMLFEEAKRSFRVESLLVIAENEDFRIVMFPRNGGFAVWKTDLEMEDIVRELHGGKNDRQKPVSEM